MNTQQQAKHTPGPWQITHLRAGIDRINQFRIGSGPFGEIARTPELPYETAQENEANARLIAAAPALLEALQAIEAALTQPVQFTKIRNGASCDILRFDCAFAVKQARAAIQAATINQ